MAASANAGFGAMVMQSERWAPAGGGGSLYYFVVGGGAAPGQQDEEEYGGGGKEFMFHIVITF